MPEKERPDAETLEIQRQIKIVGDFVKHDAWGIVESALRADILQAQNLSDIKVENFSPEELKIELRARQIAINIISKWFFDIGQTADLANENLQDEKPSYIINTEEK